MGLGGKDNFAADRWAAPQVGKSRPQVIAGARANRAFLARAVRYIASGRGIRQFCDIGPGLPARGNTHEVAQAIDPLSAASNDALLRRGWQRPNRGRPARAGGRCAAGWC